MYSKLASIKGLILRQVFNATTDVTQNLSGRGVINGGVTIAKGVATFNGTTGYISYANVLNNVKSVRIKYKNTADASSYDIMKLTSSHNIKVESSVLKGNGFSTPTVYINGVASTAITLAKNEIVITTATGINANVLELGRVTNYLAGTIELVEFYNYALSATEVYNLFNNKTFRELPTVSSDKLGADLVTNGDFSQGSGNTFTGWTKLELGSSTVVEDATGGVSSSRCVKLFVDSSNSGVGITQTSILTANKLYKLTFYAKGDGGIWTVRDSVGTNVFYTFTPTASYVQYTAYFVLTSNLGISFIRSYGISQTLWIDNVTCQEVYSTSGSLLIDFDCRQGILKDNTGLRTLTPTYGTGGIVKIGSTKAFKFDGTATKIDAGADWIGTGDRTISAWILPFGFGEGNTGRIITNTKLMFYVNSTNSTLSCTSDGSTTVNAAANAIKLGQWQFVTITRTSAGIVNFYVNGVLSGTANQASGTPAAGSSVIIGNNTGQTATFNGLIPRIKPFNRILSTYEITQEFTSQRNTFGI